MNHNFRQGNVSTMSPGMVVLCGRVTTSTGGTVSAVDVRGGGVTVTKTPAKTGRYTFTLIDAADTSLSELILLHADVTLIGPDDAAMTDAKGRDKVIRDIDIGGGADDGTFEIQFTDADTGADANIEDAAGFTFMIVLGHRDVS